jgi:hypothetical protein
MMGDGRLSSPTQFKINEAFALGNLYGNQSAFTDPSSGIVLSAGYHWLTPTEALAYVRARYGLGDGSDLERIIRQQAFMSSLISRAKSELYNPVAIYRFLDAATSTLPSFPRGEAVPSDTANVLWTQPEDSEIVASFRGDVPPSASPSASTARTRPGSRRAPPPRTSAPTDAPPRPVGITRPIPRTQQRRLAIA